MNRKTRVKVTICGVDYNIISSESIDYVKNLGTEIDEAMHKLLSNDHRISTTMAAVLSCFNYADELKKATTTSENLRDQLSAYITENARLQDEIKKLKLQNKGR